MLSLIRREDERMTPRIPTGDIADFDFLLGSWTVAHRRLKGRLVGSDEWDAFAGTSRCEKRLGGLVNVDENVFPAKGFAGMTIRVFDPAQRAVVDLLGRQPDRRVDAAGRRRLHRRSRRLLRRGSP